MMQMIADDVLARSPLYIFLVLPGFVMHHLHHLHHLHLIRKPRQMGTSCADDALSDHLHIICDHLRFCWFQARCSSNSGGLT